MQNVVGNVEALMKPVEGDAPAGENLEYTPAFAELERVAQGTPERQLGQTIVPAEGPDWRAVRAKSEALFAASKDLRVAVHFARAELALSGFEGFADALEVIDGLITGFWPSFFPQLDAEDDNDPTARANAMAALAHRDTLSLVRATPIVTSRALGGVTLRDLEAAKAGGGDAGHASVDAVFSATSDEALAASAKASERAFNAIRAIEEHWGTELPGAGPDFAPLTRLLLQVRDATKGRAGARASRAEADAIDASVSKDGAAPETGDGPPRGGAMSSDGRVIRSREDVIRAFERICAYYETYEPSSPIPLLVERCKRLVTMSFFDIVKDLMPDGVSQIENLSGKRSE